MMKLPERFPSPNRSIDQISAITKAWSLRSTLRLALPVVIAGVFLCTPLGSPVLAKGTAHTRSANTAAADIDPSAMDALNRLGVYLRTLKAFQVKADVTTDDVLEDGQIIESSTKVDLVASKPNRFRAEITGDDEHRFLFYDGKNFTIYGRLVNFYATVPAPSTMAQLTADLENKYGIELPLVDLFKWGTNEADVKKIKGAMDIGPATVDGITCEQYAFQQEGVNWQIWIQLGEFPLPRKFVIQTLTDDAKPQHSEVLTWNLAPSFSEDAFTFVPPDGAQRITIAEVKAAAKGK